MKQHTLDYSANAERSNTPIRTALQALGYAATPGIETVAGHIFLFEKLVQLVAATPETAGPAHAIDADGVAELAIDAWVSPLEAVEIWRVVPPPYVVEPAVHGGYWLRHDALNARLPTRYPDAAAVRRALIHRLNGGVEPGQGDCHDGAQPLVLCEPLTLDALPPMPVLDGDTGPDWPRYLCTHLGSVAFRSGYAPVDRLLFERVRARELIWAEQSARLQSYVAGQALRGVFERLALAFADRRNGVSQGHPTSVPTQMHALRAAFPELTVLSDAALAHQFKSYQQGVYGTCSRTPVRDPYFLWYLLGRLVDTRVTARYAPQLGAIVAWAVGAGQASEQAIETAQAWRAYDTALRSRAWRIARALQYRAEHDPSRVA